MTTPCPSTDDLRGLVDGSLADGDADALQLHIEKCVTCQAALQELVADGSFWESAAASLSDQEAAGPGLDRVVAELRQQSPDDADEMGGAIELRLSFIEPPVEPGTIGRLQNYDILRVAGRGGMGIVVKAFDRTLRRVVAIKLLAPHLAGNGQARQRFVREGRAAAGICHEHVITIHAVEENPPFLVMQYVQGETLEARINRNGALDVRETVRIAKQIAEGLVAAHAQGVVHRDIKPANILLENGVARVRITDFGLARAVDDASLTQSGVIAGTPQYMAPEQASGEPVDERADLFSLGSVIYTMLAGHAPFRATTAMGVLKRLCDHSARPIREINPDVPDWLVLLLNRLHAKRPADRFQSAEEVSVVLERGLAALQSGTTATTVFTQVERPVADSVPPETATASVRATMSESKAAAVSFWQSVPAPVWLIVLPLIVLALGPLGRFVAEMATLLLVALCLGGLTVFGWKKLATATEVSPEADRSLAGRLGRGQTRLLEITPRGWRNKLGWLLVWGLPLIAWTVFFYIQEMRAFQNHVEFLDKLDLQIAAGLVIVFCSWWAIAVLWFRRRQPDRSRLFPQGRWKRVLGVLALAGVFCVCATEVWYSDVYRYRLSWEYQRRREADVAAMAASQRAAAIRHSVRVNFAQPLDGAAVVVELPGNEHYRVTVELDGVVVSNIGSKSGTFPWRASVGHTEFATGEVTLASDTVAAINVPPPKLEQLISGRWDSVPEPPGGYGGVPGGGEFGPGMGPEMGQEVKTVLENYQFEFDDHKFLLATRTMPGRFHRNDAIFEIDDSVTPALINLLLSDGSRIAGILRFVPGRVLTDDGAGGEMLSMGGAPGMPDGARMGMDGGSGPGGWGPSETPDVLELCLNDGSGLRPWEFKLDQQRGQTLFRLERSRAKISLWDELAFEPVRNGASGPLVEESVVAWTKRLKIVASGRNSLGMELVLVPPAGVRFQNGPGSGSNQLKLPEGLVAGDASGPAGPPLPGMSSPSSMMGGMNGGASTVPKPLEVTYPFVITKRPISLGQFQKFAEATGYLTDAERGTPLVKLVRRPRSEGAGAGYPGAGGSGYPGAGGSGHPGAGGSDGAEAAAPGAEPEKASAPDEASAPRSDPGGWQRDGDGFVFVKDVSWRSLLPALSDPNADPAVTWISWRDATEFCEWLSETEGRQYRLPTMLEWAAAMQIGIKVVPAWPGDDTTDPERVFDAKSPHVLGINSPEQVFGEWTQGSYFLHEMMNDVPLTSLATRDLSSDGKWFGCHSRYSPQTIFRSSDITFHVVAELQTLSGRNESGK